MRWLGMSRSDLTRAPAACQILRDERLLVVVCHPDPVHPATASWPNMTRASSLICCKDYIGLATPLNVDTSVYARLTRHFIASSYSL